MTEYRQTRKVSPKQQVVRDAATTANVVDWMIPIIAERSKVANDIIPSKFWQYNQHKYRVCSCYDNQPDPDANCAACFGTGYLPGYVPEGYLSYISLEVSDSGLIMVNARPNFDSGKNPAPIELEPTALSGFVETNWQLAGPNLGQFQVFYVGSTSGLTLEVTVDGETWFDLTEKYDERLATATRVKFRAFLQRSSLDDPQPFIQVLHARLQVQKDPLISLDVPRWVANLNSADAGLIPLLETFNGFADSRYKLEQTTIYIHQLSKRKFKTLTLTPNLPGGILTSWDLTLRLIQPDESLANLL